jgi:hypothetical protein
MKALLIALAFLTMHAALAADPFVPKKPMIQLEQLEEMFSQMRAKAPWNVDGPLLWGYFFTDRNAEKLKPVAKLLQERGYRLVNIYPTDDRSTFVLHVEKIEHHTPASLDTRNHEFYRLAEEYRLDSYDGMDVGPAS